MQSNQKPSNGHTSTHHSPHQHTLLGLSRLDLKQDLGESCRSGEVVSMPSPSTTSLSKGTVGLAKEDGRRKRARKASFKWSFMIVVVALLIVVRVVLFLIDRGSYL